MFSLLMAFLFIGLVIVFWVIQKYSTETRSRAGVLCPTVHVPADNACASGWSYQARSDNGCPVFLCLGKKLSHIPACPGPGGKDSPRCHARVLSDAGGGPKANTTPVGYGPAQLRGAYGVTGRVTSGIPIIAVVTAFDNPNIKSDLDTYNRQFGLPSFPTCKGAIANSNVPCFKKVNQTGGTTYPAVDRSWARETALDVEVAHAMCENCSILLVEATSATYDNLLASVDRARALGARIISNSWGSQEFSGQNAYDSHFPQPGYVYTFSSGDTGYGAQYPAASPNVTAVGGTSLTVSGTGTYVSETAWSGAGSGCSAYETKPASQTDAQCAKRTIADVSAVADPNTGAAIYDSTNAIGRQTWFVYGGTSLSTPIIAAMYALAGFSGTQNGQMVPYQQGSITTLHDITTGSNGSCNGSYLCTAQNGYDGPTGLGTPKGSGAF